METWLALLVGGAAVCCDACSPPDVSIRPPKVPTHPPVCRCCLLLPWLLPACLPPAAVDHARKDYKFGFGLSVGE
jgi:hypothetical protein